MNSVVRTKLLRAIVELLEHHRITEIPLPITETMLWDGLGSALEAEQAYADAAIQKACDLVAVSSGAVAIAPLPWSAATAYSNRSSSD